MHPAITAIIIYYLIVKMTPKILKKPVGNEFVDDFVLYCISQNGFLTSGAIMILMIFLIQDKFLNGS
jgi:hypothetical protein